MNLAHSPFYRLHPALPTRKPGEPLLSSLTSGLTATESLTIDTIGGDIAGGAVGGFISGTSLGLISGQNLGQALKSGLMGAEGGAITGGIAGAESCLNQAGDFFAIPGVKGGFSADMLKQDAIGIAGRALETAVANSLEDKNASLGFWSGLVSGGEAFFNPEPGYSGWTIPEDLAKGIVGGLGSMNKQGKGFMTGFWSQEVNVATADLNQWITKNWLKGDSPYLQDSALGTAAGLMGGVGSYLAGKTFASGLFTGLASAGIKDIFSLDPARQKPAPGDPTSIFALIPNAVTNGFNLLQPKVVKGHSVLPLGKIKGGYWALGIPYSVLY